MKKIYTMVLICLCLVCMASVAIADNTVREDCGCGLGGYAIGNETGLVWKLVGTFLNGISGNQTFAMSTGTLGCGTPQKLAVMEHLNIFVADNMDELAVDIAKGEGESLDALAEIANIPADQRPNFYSDLQKNFDRIYASDDVTNENVANEISTILSSNS